MRSPEGARISVWYKRVDRALEKLRSNNTVVFSAKRKRIPSQTVTIVRYDLSGVCRNQELKTQVLTAAGRKLNGARPIGPEWSNMWEIPYTFNPMVPTGELGVVWRLRLTFKGCHPLVDVDYASARGCVCSGSCIFNLDADLKLAASMAEQMVEGSGWCANELASDSYAKTLKILNVSNIDDLPAMLLSSDRTVTCVSRLLKDHLNTPIQQDIFRLIELESGLELTNNI